MKKIVFGGIALIVFLWFCWFIRPLGHWFWVFAYRNPTFWEVPLGATIIGLIVWRLTKGSDGQGLITFLTVALLLVVGWGIGGSFQVAYTQCYLAENLKVKVTEVQHLPDMDPEVIRILPRTVAQRYAEDALQYPRHKLGTSDISYVEGKPFWVFPLVPDGAINFFTLKGNGALYVAMDTGDKNTSIIEKKMEIGPGMGVSDWYKWKLYKTKYWVDYEDPYFVLAEKELYLVAPVISYEWHFRFFPIPTFYTVPRWDGTVLIDSAGKIEFLNPEKAQKSPILEGQKLYPELMSRYYINSFRYIHGIWNRLARHLDQIKIAEIDVRTAEAEGKITVQRNRQPFLVATEQGLKWLIACEPFGKAYGIYKIFLIDARNGEIQSFGVPKQEALLGPVRASDYVRKENPVVDWSRMTPVEPIPIVRNGLLYWEIRVIPRDGSGVSYTAFINSKNGKVFPCYSDQAVRDFVKGVTVTVEKIPEAVVKEEAGKGGFLIIIYEGNVEKQRIRVPEGTRIEIQKLR